MPGDSTLLREALKRDLVFKMTWMPIGCVFVIFAVQPLVLLRALGIPIDEILIGCYGIGMVILGGISLLHTSRMLARRFGVRCPKCNRVLSLFALDYERRNKFLRSRSCPYCKDRDEQKELTPEQRGRVGASIGHRR